MNYKTVSVELHTVKSYSMQEKFSISGEIFRKSNVNYVKSAVKNPLRIKEGAYAGITVDGKFYDGYLKEITRLTGGTAVACVSIVSDKELTGNADAEVYGNICENVIMIPENCIFNDEDGFPSVMIASRGYLVKRNVAVGNIKNSKGVQITSGLFPDEKIVKNPKDVKTGDRYEQ